ncbi:MAG: UDP-N-acetylmuramoyl-L-alanyl-D-glutamate--2,6-diaminopimelate ligase [Patescibacteria group bacterium]
MWQKIKNIYHYLQALISAIYFGFPSKKLTVIAVTGTDGKTTTVNMIHHIFTAAGKKVSMVSSIGAQIGAKSQDTGYHVSTPNPWQIQGLLKKATDEKSDYFVLEATSHGLDQNRLAFIKIHTAVITNISSEHLDYHKNIENYSLAKLKLFKNCQTSILNRDDTYFDVFKKAARGKIITYSQMHSADISPKNFPINLQVIGTYNLANALAASAVAQTLDIKKSVILKSLTTFSGIKGRMESVDLGQNFTAIIDFAHTPNALKEALTSLKKQYPKSKITAMFGAAGQRDKSKRHTMGALAAKLADFTVITSEDPRREDPGEIALEIASGFSEFSKKEEKDYKIILDRKEAIHCAIESVKDNDVVVFFGKGHEKSICVGKTEIPWDEYKEVEKAIKRKLKNGK